MPNVGAITGSMYLDPSAYIAGLNQAADTTRMFQQGIDRISFAGFHRGIFATTTMLYGLSRVISSMSQGMEEYSNLLGRIGSVADMTAASVEALSESLKRLSVTQGASRRDLLGGMYTAAQSGFDSPAEMRAMATSGALLSRASGKEIDVKKSVDLLSVARQALGIGKDAVSSNRMTDLLLKGRDIGRWELDEMAHALGIPLTVYGNQFASKIGGEETLRQLQAIMSTATLSGMNPAMTGTGTRRLVERTVQLNKTKLGDPLRQALRDIGFSGSDPIGRALDKGPISFLNTLLQITGGQTSELNRLGYGSRDLMLLTSAMRGKGDVLNSTYESMSPENVMGLTERYNRKMQGTYDFTREQLRAKWEITSQEFMQASIPFIERLTTALGGLNDIAQNLPQSTKSLIMLTSALVSMRLALNFLGFRTIHKGADAVGGMGGAALSGVAQGRASNFQYLRTGNGNFYYPLGLSASAGGTPLPLIGSPSRALRPAVGAFTPSSGNLGAAIPSSGNIGAYTPSSFAPSYPPLTSGNMGAFMPSSGNLGAYMLASGNIGAYTPSSGNIGAYTPSSFGGGKIAPYRLDNGSHFYPLGKPMQPPAGPSFARQLGTYMGARSVFENAGISARAPGYAAMGVGMAAQVAGSVSFGAMRLGSAFAELLGPLAKFGIALSGATTIVEAVTYRQKNQKIDGRTQMRAGGMPVLQELLQTPFRSLGFLTSKLFNPDHEEYVADFARKHGGVFDPKRGWSSTQAFVRTGQTALAGYRDVEMNDVLEIAGREHFGPKDREALARKGIDFSSFEKIRPYLNEHLKSLGSEAPGDWTQYVRETVGGIDEVAQLIADAIKRAAEKIQEATTSIGPAWQGSWRASMPDQFGQFLARNQILSGRQWEIYSGADYATGKNGALNWNAGGQDFRSKYNESISELDRTYGGFTKTPYDKTAKAALAERTAMWKQRAAGVGASFGDMTLAPEEEHMLKKGTEYRLKQKNLRGFLDVMPDLGSMAIEEQQKWFEKLTGRIPGTDGFSTANFDNFRNMDLSNFVSAEMVKRGTQYESATQFGTAEAYNQLLPREEPIFKIQVAVDRIEKFVESLSVSDEAVETELTQMAKKANTFFELAESSKFFENVAKIEENTGE